MKNNIFKIVGMSSHSVKFLCFALALILLLLPFTVIVKDVTYIVPAGQYRQEYDSEADYLRMNFFRYVKYLDNNGCSVGTETIFIVFIVLNMLVVVALAALDLIMLVRKKTLPLAMKIITMVLLVLPLASLVLAIILQNDADVWHYISYRNIYFGLEGRVYVETLARGEIIMIPAIILSFLGLAAATVAAIFNLLTKKPQPVIAEECEETPAEEQGEAIEEAPTSAPANDAEALIKYKQLLDMGVITQEEFDAKKKEILGL